MTESEQEASPASGPEAPDPSSQAEVSEPASEPGADTEEATESSDSRDAVDEYRPEFSPELFLGIARPLGTAGEEAVDELANAFDDYGYTMIRIRTSSLLEDSLIDSTNEAVSGKFDERIEALIGEGNRICEAADNGAAVVDLAIDEIRRLRPSEDKVDATSSSAEAGDAKSMRRVFLINGLKRPDEILALRKLYGDHFILVGLQATERDRSSRLRANLATRGTHSGADARSRATALLEMDNQDTVKYGQQMTTTMAMSDVFIRVDSDETARLESRKFVELLFGDPKARLPSTAEYGMQLARQTSFRSPELGLRVGAVIIGATGDVLATGFNHHPTTESSPDYDFSAVDLIGLARNTVTLLADDHRLADEDEEALRRDPDEYVRDLLRGALRNSQLRGVTEYQRPVHAEMDALLSALRQRSDIGGSTMFVTDFPCHGCARHLIAMRLKLVYLVPYTKSRAIDMYGDEADKFVPYTGVAPARYQQWFGDGSARDRKDAFGRRRTWGRDEREQAMPGVDLLVDNSVFDQREIARARYWREL